MGLLANGKKDAKVNEVKSDQDIIGDGVVYPLKVTCKKPTARHHYSTIKNFSRCIRSQGTHVYMDSAGKTCLHYMRNVLRCLWIIQQ